jgi:hypothetical protein
MRAFLFAALFLLAASPSSPADTPPAPANETLQYKIEWRLVRAGTVNLDWNRSGEGYQARLQLRSTGLVSMLYKVDSLYQAEMSPELCAIDSLLTANEGSRSRETKVTFDAERGKASYLERDLKKNATVATKEIEIPPCVLDVMGGLYRLRRMNLPVGKSAEIPISDGKKSVMARIEAQQKESVETPAGNFKAVLYEAFLFNNVLYRRSGRMFIWLTDDERKLPVQIRFRLSFPVGTVTLQLEKTEKP